MSEYHCVKVDGALYVPLSHWETVVTDRDKYKKLYEELLASIVGGPTIDRVEKLHNEIVDLVGGYND